MTVIRLSLILLIFQSACSIKKDLTFERVRYENQIEAILTYFDQLHDDCQPHCIYNVSPNFDSINKEELNAEFKRMLGENEIQYEKFSILPIQISHDIGEIKFYEHLEDKYKFSPLVVSENGRELAFFVKPPNHYLHFVLFSRIGSELVVIVETIL